MSSRDPVRAYWASFIALGFCLNLVGPALTTLRHQVGVGVGAISVLFAVQSVGYMAGSLAGGRLYDRGHGHLILASSLLLVAATLLVVPYTSSLVAMAAVFAVMGIGGGGIDVGGNTLLAWSRTEGLGPAMNALHLCFGIGALACPLVVGWAVGGDTGDLHRASWILAVAPVVAAAYVMACPAPHVPSHPTEVPGEATARTPTALLLVAGFFALYVGVEVGFGGWVHTYGESVGIGSAGRAAWLTSLFWGGFTGGRIVAIAVTRRISVAAMLLGTSIGVVGLMVVLVIANGSTVVLWPASALLGFALAPQFPSMMALADERLRLTGSATAWFVSAAGVGGLTLPWFIGQLLDHFGAGAMPITVLVGSVILLGWVVMVERRLSRLAVIVR